MVWLSALVLSPWTTCSPMIDSPMASSGIRLWQVPGWFVSAQVPVAAAQPLPDGHDPQSPPQPLSPHTLPVQSGVRIEKHAAHELPLTLCEQVPVGSSQTSSVHDCPSSQGGMPGTHVPPTN